MAIGCRRGDLVTGLQIAFETRSLEIAKGIAAVETLISELMLMRVAVSAAGHERYGVWREGVHDDLVLAVALAWWGDQPAGAASGVGSAAVDLRLGCGSRIGATKAGCGLVTSMR